MNPATPVEVKRPVNYVLVDCENVGAVSPAFLDNKPVHLTLLLGPNQKKLDADLVEKLLEHAASVRIVRLTSPQKKNALDFALAFYLGRAVDADPTAYFHIISKDTGFDSLIEHLKGRHVHVHRHENCDTLPFTAVPKAPPPPPQDDLMERVVAQLRKDPKSRPKTKKKLLSHLVANSGKTNSDQNAESEAAKLIGRMVDAGHIAIGDKEAVTYHLDSK